MGAAGSNSDYQQMMWSLMAQQMLWGMQLQEQKPQDRSVCKHIWRVRGGRLVCDLCKNGKPFR